MFVLQSFLRPQSSGLLQLPTLGTFFFPFKLLVTCRRRRMQPIFLLLSLYEHMCQGQHARSYFWDIWFKIMRKPTQAVRWMEHTSEQVAGSTQAQWGGGQFPELGGRVCFPGDSALPSWEDTYCSGICWARRDQKELSRKASMPAAQQRREFPLLSNDLLWMNMKQ